MKLSVNWLKDFVKFGPPFERIADRLTMAGLEVKKVTPTPDQKDIVFEVEVTTNRPDWLSHLGVAREIAAVENLSLQIPAVDVQTSRPMAPGWKVFIKDAEPCPFYTGVLIEGITPAKSPDFMVERLAACGLRSIHLIVDITNFILLEMGQPLHAFDADLIRGQEVHARPAKPGETLVAIDGSEQKLLTEDLVIADHDRAIAIAGVMGGRDTEVNDRTRNIFLESAFFHPRWIRRTSRRLGLASESSYRFERLVDPKGVEFASQRAIYLIKQYAKPRFIGGMIKAGRCPEPNPHRIHLLAADVAKWLGVEIKPTQIHSSLVRLGLDVKQNSPVSWSLGIPSFRSDLERPVDLIEEVARIYGYDNIPETLPARAPLAHPSHPRLKLDRKARQFFSGAGLFETVTFSLISDKGFNGGKDLTDAVRLINPQNKELCWMRPTLLPSLLDVIRVNRDHGAQSVPVFEVANVYRLAADRKGTVEERMAGLALHGPVRKKNWLDPERAVTFYDIKGLVESFLESAGVYDAAFKAGDHAFLNATCSEILWLGSEPAGFLGEVASSALGIWDLDQPVFYAELSLEKVLVHARRGIELQSLAVYPPVQRDLSIVVPESTKAGQVREFITGLGFEWVGQVEVFDLFRGKRIPEGFKNLAFRITYQAHDRTLVSSEIQKLHDDIAAKTAAKFAASFQ